MSLYNRENTEHKTGEHNLILGQPSGLLDTINRKHQPLFDLYKLQKNIDWSEDEINLEKSRMDLASCPEAIYGAAIENLSYQFETDSIAVNSLLYCFAPFVTDSDWRLAITKITEIEGLHALTYSEIIRLAAPDPNKVIDNIQTNPALEDRNRKVITILEELKAAGCQYSLGLLENNQELYDKAFLGAIAFYLLERVQFMSSFAHTFALAEAGYMQGVAKLVQKVMNDELFVHARVWEYVLKTEMNTTRGVNAYMNNREVIEALLLEVLQGEYDWNSHIFSKFTIPNVNENLMNKWAEYNAQEAFSLLMIDPPFALQDKSPMKYMENWMDINKFQNANQEGDNNNYELNCFARDIPEGKIYDKY